MDWDNWKALLPTKAGRPVLYYSCQFAHFVIEGDCIRLLRNGDKIRAWLENNPNSVFIDLRN